MKWENFFQLNLVLSCRRSVVLVEFSRAFIRKRIMARKFKSLRLVVSHYVKNSRTLTKTLTQGNFCKSKAQANCDETQIFGKVCHLGWKIHLKIIKTTDKLVKLVQSRWKSLRNGPTLSASWNWACLYGQAFKLHTQASLPKIKSLIGVSVTN